MNSITGDWQFVLEHGILSLETHAIWFCSLYSVICGQFSLQGFYVLSVYIKCRPSEITHFMGCSVESSVRDPSVVAKYNALVETNKEKPQVRPVSIIEVRSSHD